MRPQHKKICHRSSTARSRRRDMVSAAAAVLLPILLVPPSTVSVSAYSLLRPGGILGRVLLPHHRLHSPTAASRRPRQHNPQRFLGSSTSSSGDDGGAEDRWEEAKGLPADPLSSPTPSSSSSSSSSSSISSSSTSTTKGFIPPVHFKEPDEFSFIKSTLLTNFMFQSLPGKIGRDFCCVDLLLYLLLIL